VSSLETDYHKHLEEAPAEQGTLEHKLERAQPAQPSEKTPMLSPEGRAAVEKHIQGIEKTDQSQVPESHIVGTPERDARYLHEQTGETCATVAQEGILEKHAGVDHGEKALAQEAHENGWTDESGGTFPDHVGDLLDKHGVPTQRWLDGSADLNTVRNELAQGHDVIAGVDAGELYRDADKIGTGHAVWVTGVEVGPDEQAARVFVNDSNFPEPQVHDAQTFQNAWDAGDRLMVATRQAAPSA